MHPQYSERLLFVNAKMSTAIFTFRGFIATVWSADGGSRTQQAPAGAAVLKTAVYAVPPRPHHGGEHPKMLPVAVSESGEWWTPDSRLHVTNRIL